MSIQEAEARAARNGLTLELGDTDAGSAWPGVRYASAHLMRGREQVAGIAISYWDEASKQRALLSGLERVFFTPTG